MMSNAKHICTNSNENDVMSQATCLPTKLARELPAEDQYAYTSAITRVYNFKRGFYFWDRHAQLTKASPINSTQSIAATDVQVLVSEHFVSEQ